MIIDIHCHCTYTCWHAQPGERFSFEPAEENGRPTLDSFVSPRALRYPSWRLAKLFFNVAGRLQAGPALDQVLADFYETHLLADGPVERIVLLAFDRYHDDQGHRPPPPEARRQPGSDIYTSNSFVLDACRRHPKRFLFGASVHPYRANAVACVEEVFARGACLLKWIPLHQNVNIADPRTLDVLRCCARLGLPVLVHYSEEFTLATQHPAYRPIGALLNVLRQLRAEGRMPTTIVAHVATPVTPLGERRSHKALLDALQGEFADPPLYADIAALTSWAKIGFLRKLARRQDLHAKLIFGTDFPVPLALRRLRRDLGRDYRRIRTERSWIQQAALICRRMGFNEIVFHRAAELLPNTTHLA
jgi:hypothetical protein